MSKSWHRFEILLPLRFNDGQPVPDELIVDLLLQLEQRFQAVSTETQRIRGIWRYQGTRYQDELVRVFVDTQDSAEVRAFFAQFKETLKTKLQQIDIWMTAYPIEIL